MSYSSGAQIVYEKTNIFYLSSGGATESTIIIGCHSIRWFHAIAASEAIPY